MSIVNYQLPKAPFIGKEKDNESYLGDFGVRKFDDGIGRFTSTEPIWEEYYSWAPYQYSANNPILYIDGSGNVIELKRINDSQTLAYNAMFNELETLAEQSPTISNILEKAKGTNTLIHIYTFLKKPTSSESKTKSINFPPNIIEDEWDNFHATHFTDHLEVDGFRKSDVYFLLDQDGDSKPDDMFDSFKLLDEFYHATVGTGTQTQQHINLYGALLKEIEAGTLVVDRITKYRFQVQYDGAVEALKSESTESSEE